MNSIQLRCYILAVLAISTSASTYAQIVSGLEEITWHTNGPGKVVAHDLDEDGDMDVIQANAAYAGNKISWFENDGSGRFIQEHFVTTYAVNPAILELADMDGDGDMDVVAMVNDGGYKTRWFENSGLGVFTTMHLVTTGQEGSKSLAVADLDGDGDMDIISTREDFSPEHLVWYPNDGSGNFGEYLTISTSSNDVQDLLVVDMDDDGDLDIVAAQTSFYLLWFENNGGSFTQLILDNDWGHTYDLKAGDMDQDGDLDILVTYHFDGRIKWLSNLGGGNFSAPQQITFEMLDAREAILLDMDGDGDLDVVGTSSTGAAWFRNLGGAATFSPRIIIETNFGITKSVAHADIDMDGHQDLVFATWDRITWSRSLGGAGTLERAKTISPQTHSVKAMRYGDMDNDGDLDLIVSSTHFDKVSLIENLGGGNFAVPRDITGPDDLVIDMEVVDVDGDGHLDVVTASSLNSRVGWYRNDGTANFEPQRNVGSDMNPRRVAVLDVDQDGDIDVAAVSQNNGPLSWYRQNATPFSFTTVNLATGLYQPRALCATDVNGDGLKDLVAYASSQDDLFWYPSLPEGGFGPMTMIDANTSGNDAIKALDVDADGDQDLVLISVYFNQVRFYRNLGGGVFGTVEVLDASTVLESFDVGDVDADGDLDIVVAYGYPGSNIRWHENLGAAGLAPPQPLWVPVTEQLQKIMLCDIDSDGVLDIVGLLKQANCVAMIRNDMHPGCTDAAALNYQSGAITDNGTCCFTALGCSVAGSVDYAGPDACNGTCTFLVGGRVFIDANGNGSLDVDEEGVPGQGIRLYPDDIIIYTDANGDFSTSVSGSTSYSFLLTDPGQMWVNTTPALRSFDATLDNWNQPVNFGIQAGNANYSTSLDIVPATSTYPCDGTVLHHFNVTNSGNRTMDLVVAVSYDAAFSGHQAVTPVDSVGQGTLYYSATALAPGGTFMIEVAFLTPGSDLQGMAFDVVMQVFGHANGQQVSTADHGIGISMTCIDDPSLKQGMPEGYTDAQFIQAGEDLEYIIRFQNPGPDLVSTVIIVDTLAPGLDVNSFASLSSSHPVNVAFNAQQRVVTATFTDIGLPGSNNDPVGSWGYFSFTVKVAAGTLPLTQMTNSAAIFFDGSFHAITNTTLHTIMDCSLMTAVPSVDTIEVCQGEEFTVGVSGTLLEELEWNLASELVGTGSSITLSIPSTTSPPLVLNYGNPLCSAQLEIPILLQASPELSVEGEAGFCAGGSTALFAITDLPVEWTFNGQYISSEDSVAVDEAGVYAVMVSDGECNTTVTTSVTEYALPEEPEVNVDGTLLSVTDLPGHTYQWFLNGELILEATGPVWEAQSNGMYSVGITDINGCSNTSQSVAVIQVDIKVEKHDPIRVYPNPAREQLRVEMRPTGTPVQLEVFDAAGRSILKEVHASKELMVLDLSGSDAGTYVLKVIHDQHGTYFRFVLQ